MLLVYKLQFYEYHDQYLKVEPDFQSILKSIEVDYLSESQEDEIFSCAPIRQGTDLENVINQLE
jgi:hypothetical protein